MAFIPSPAAIGAQLLELDGQAKEIDIAFSQCTPDPPVLKDQWAAAYENYQAFSRDAHAYLGSILAMVSSPWLYASSLPDMADAVDSYARGLNTWADLANEKCGGNASKTSPRKPAGAELTDILEAGTILLVAGAGVYLLVTLLPRKR